MTPVSALVKVTAEIEPLFIDAPAIMRPLAASLVVTAVKQAHPEPGFYRIDVEGNAKKPTVRLARLAPLSSVVAAALVERESPESVRVVEARASAGADRERLQGALAEAAATAAPKLKVGQRAFMTLVI